MKICFAVAAEWNDANELEKQNPVKAYISWWLQCLIAWSRGGVTIISNIKLPKQKSYFFSSGQLPTSYYALESCGLSMVLLLLINLLWRSHQQQHRLGCEKVPAQWFSLCIQGVCPEVAWAVGVVSLFACFVPRKKESVWIV